MAAAPSTLTTHAQCPDCGTPLEITLKTEFHPGGVAEGRSYVGVQISGSDVVDRVLEHKAAGQCGRDKPRTTFTVTDTDGNVVHTATYDGAPTVRLWDADMNYLGPLPDGVEVSSDG